MDQFLLTAIASLAVYDTLKTFKFSDISIKWPNDILIKNKKIAGILIENKISGKYIKHSIVGIGINVYQKEFPDEIKQRTTSLALESYNFSIELVDLAEIILQKIKLYMALTKQNHLIVLKEYNDKLFSKNEKHSYLFEENIVEGTIIQVEKDGLLQIEIGKTLHKVDLKSITYIL